MRVLAALLLLGCASPPPEVPPEQHATGLTATGTPPAQHATGRYVMGTLLEVVVPAPASEVEALASELAELARGLEVQLSRWRPDSALSHLNAAAGAGPQPVPTVLARVVADSVALSRATGGSFDVSVGPLVALWTLAAERDRLPSAAALAEARGRVGAGRIRVTVDPARVELPRAGMALDLGGVAKGWALDRMRERLLARGVERALVSFGGSSVLALGAPPETRGWRVLLRDGSAGYAGVLTLRDAMLSVSGSFGRVSRVAGRDYGHVIDPRSGLPLDEGRQAAIVAPTGAAAEAWSKALLVLTPGESQRLLAEQPSTEGLLLREGHPPLATPGWHAATRFERL